MTITKPLDKIACLFLGSDFDRRQWMTQLNEQDGFVYGTDAHCLIKAPVSLFDSKYPPHAKTANFKSLYENYTYNNEAINISVSKAKLLLLNIEKVFDECDCPECNGDGNVTCNYGHEHECEECNGLGVQENRMKPKVYPKDDNYIQIIDSYISPFYIDKLVKVADFIGLINISMVSYHTEKAHIFNCGEVEIILMPISKGNTENWEDKTIHKLV